MKFSIIIPVFNAENFLDDCIGSVLKQSYNNYELILVNDGSLDNSLNICRNYEKKDKRIKILDKKNEGATIARLSGAKMAKGEYIVSIDSDDYIDYDLLERANNILKKHNYDFITLGFKTIYNKTIINKKNNKIEKGEYLQDKINYLKAYYLYDINEKRLNDGKLLYSIPCKIIKRELYLKSHEYVKSVITNGEDTVFTAALLNLISSAYVDDYYGYNYRINENSITKFRKYEDLENLILVTNELSEFKYLSNERISGYYYNCLWNIITGLAKSSKNYRTFKNSLKGFELKKKCKKYKLGMLKVSIKDIIKIRLLKSGNLFILYKINNILFHN